jgi:hypothetical protein
MNTTIKNIIVAVVSAVILASGAFAFDTTSRLATLDAKMVVLERIEDKLDKVMEEQRQVRVDLHRVIPRQPVISARPEVQPKVTERSNP